MYLIVYLLVHSQPFSVDGRVLTIRVQRNDTTGAFYGGMLASVDYTGTGFSQTYGYSHLFFFIIFASPYETHFYFK